MVNKSLMVAVGVPEANPTFISGRGTRHAYISGANKTRQKIGMTTPVEIAKPSIKILMTTPVEINTTNDAGVMRFFIPSNYSKNDLTDPSDPRVKLVELEPMTAAVLAFSGTTGDKAVSMRSTELMAALAVAFTQICKI